MTAGELTVSPADGGIGWPGQSSAGVCPVGADKGELVGWPALLPQGSDPGL
jgi:hypothetical protein